MSKLKTIFFAVGATTLAASAAYLQTAPAFSALRKMSALQAEASSRADAKCGDNLEFTPLRASPAGKALVIEPGPGTRPGSNSSIVVALMNAASRNGVTAYSTEQEPDYYASFSVRKVAPADAWKLVVESVPASQAMAPSAMGRTAVYRAALFDDKGVEQGRWQGGQLNDNFGAKSCPGTKEAVLWRYLQLPETVSYASRNDRTPTGVGRVEVQAFSADQQLSTLPAVSYSSSSCTVVLAAPEEGKRSSTYRVTSGARQLDIQSSGLLSRGAAPRPTAFSCDDEGVTAASLTGAKRFSWEGSELYAWSYTVPGLLTEQQAALTIAKKSGSGGADVVLDYKQAQKDAGYRITLPDWKSKPAIATPAGMTQAGTNRIVAPTGMLRAGTDRFVAPQEATTVAYDKCDPPGSVEGLRKLRGSVSAPNSPYGEQADSFALTATGEYVRLGGLDIAPSAEPVAVLVDAGGMLPVITLAPNANVSYIEVHGSKGTAVVRNGPPDLKVSIVTDYCAKPLQRAPDAPKPGSLFDSVRRSAPQLTTAQAPVAGLVEVFASRDALMRRLQDQGVLQKLTASDVAGIMADYAATKPLATRLKAKFWDATALDTSLPHARNHYLIVKPTALPPGSTQMEFSDVYFVAKGTPRPTGEKTALRVLDINTYQCVGAAFWCPWPAR